MTRQFYVVGVRISSGTSTDEGNFRNEAQALAHLDSLGGDPDCLLAEVESFPTGGSVGRVDIIAQAERIDGEWRRVDGELRRRTSHGEAEQLLRDAKSEGH